MRRASRSPIPTAIVLATGLFAGASSVRAHEAPGWTYAPLDATQTRSLRDAITEMKTNARGPYRRIRWFCSDGTVLPPQAYACGEHGGGHQHAEMRPDVTALGKLGFHFGTILRATPYEQFLDAANSNYRLRELVLQRYLERTDDGWVMRRARYYRGARQSEDEEAVGRDYLRRALADAAWRRQHPLLGTLVAAVVPHGQPGVAGARVRALAAEIAGVDPGFMDLRIKIHSTPGPEDLAAVRAYEEGLDAATPVSTRDPLARLIDELQLAYGTGLEAPRWRALAAPLAGLAVGPEVDSLPQRLQALPATARIEALATLLRHLRDALERDDLGDSPSQAGRRALALVDVIGHATDALFTQTNAWLAELPTRRPAPSRRQLLQVAGSLLDGAYGSGWLSAREHDSLRHAVLALDATAPADLTRGRYRAAVDYITRAVDWGAGAIEQALGPVVQRYLPVEPLAAGFRDDAVRGSLLLPLARLMQPLVADGSHQLGIVHMLLEAEPDSGVVALNPGVAVGKLYVIRDPLAVHDLDPEGIYALPETPAHLGRVAGILTLGGGSRLSHVQLLARGMGIPNAAIPAAALDALLPSVGREVLYAVSPVGSVILRATRDIPAQELATFGRKDPAAAEAVTIDTDRLDLSVRSVLPLDQVSGRDSGRIAGPKAANLGQLHQMFPDRVAPGLVIPFGIFRAHIDRDLDGNGRTLRQEIVDVFATEKRQRAAGREPETVRQEVLRGLQHIRDEILGMDLLPRFRNELIHMLARRFGAPGTYGVFVRSDTNVEDLPNFSGAGLNLTVMNTIGTDAILRAVREVWASPFSARSYEWRQQIITNPEAVVPSIVVLRSVPSEASGVLVTTDVEGVAALEDDIDAGAVWTVTLAKGVGGVVGGGAAETVALPTSPDSSWQPILLASARAPWAQILRRSGAGGMQRVPVAGNVELLNAARAADLQAVVQQIVARYPPSYDPEGQPMPWDIEFGFIGDRTWLFQIRPFVSNRLVQTLDLLRRLDRQVLANGFQPLDLDASPEIP